LRQVPNGEPGIEWIQDITDPLEYQLDDDIFDFRE